MTDTIESIARSLSADVRAVNTISHNVANLNTPGFRAGRAMPGFDAALDGRALDLRDGALAPTGSPLDLALRGRGFFVVERDGAPLLVRGGDLRLDAEGRLVTAAGDPVLGESGQITLDSADVAIADDGVISADGKELAKLRLVDVADPSLLIAAAGGGYAYAGETIPWQGRVVQGALERANVDAADQTVQLMELTRHAESVQRAISIYDKAMDAGINRLGDN